jgi:hypothetical protein
MVLNHRVELCTRGSSDRRSTVELEQDIKWSLVRESNSGVRITGAAS